MKICLWIDDTRPPPDNSWTWAKNALEAISWLRLYTVEEMSIDHDLGNCEACNGCKGFKNCGCECHLKGRFIIWWMYVERNWPLTKPKVHCKGPENKKYMEEVIDRYYNPKY